MYRTLCSLLAWFKFELYNAAKKVLLTRSQRLRRERRKAYLHHIRREAYFINLIWRKPFFFSLLQLGAYTFYQHRCFHCNVFIYRLADLLRNWRGSYGMDLFAGWLSCLPLLVSILRWTKKRVEQIKSDDAANYLYTGLQLLTEVFNFTWKLQKMFLEYFKEREESQVEAQKNAAEDQHSEDIAVIRVKGIRIWKTEIGTEGRQCKETIYNGWKKTFFGCKTSSRLFRKKKFKNWERCRDKKSGQCLNREDRTGNKATQNIACSWVYSSHVWVISTGWSHSYRQGITFKSRPPSIFENARIPVRSKSSISHELYVLRAIKRG